MTARDIGLKLEIRAAGQEDMEAVRSIYNYWVINSVATFDTSQQSPAERLDWFTKHQENDLPVIVAESAGQIIGWASLSFYHSRCAYKQTVEPSVYIHPEHVGKGAGRQLLQALITLSEQKGYHCLVALICSQNNSSISLFQSAGFQVVGTLKQVGRKFDRWLDVTITQKML